MFVRPAEISNTVSSTSITFFFLKTITTLHHAHQRNRKMKWHSCHRSLLRLVATSLRFIAHIQERMQERWGDAMGKWDSAHCFGCAESIYEWTSSYSWSDSSAIVELSSARGVSCAKSEPNGQFRLTMRENSLTIGNLPKYFRIRTHNNVCCSRFFLFNFKWHIKWLAHTNRSISTYTCTSVTHMAHKWTNMQRSRNSNWDNRIQLQRYFFGEALEKGEKK